MPTEEASQVCPKSSDLNTPVFPGISYRPGKFQS